MTLRFLKSIKQFWKFLKTRETPLFEWDKMMSPILSPSSGTVCSVKLFPRSLPRMLAQYRQECNCVARYHGWNVGHFVRFVSISIFLGNFYHFWWFLGADWCSSLEFTDCILSDWTPSNLIVTRGRQRKRFWFVQKNDLKYKMLKNPWLYN